MRIENCNFCGMRIYPGHGMMFVRNDCKLFRFCSSKCRKNFGMKRNPMKLKWTKTFRKANNKELTAEDSSMEFEKRRHVPVKYNRELIDTTLKVMHRVNDIKQRRQKDLWKARMERTAVNRAKETAHVVEKNIDWIENKEQQAEVVQNVKKIRQHQKTMKQNKLAKQAAARKKERTAETQ